MHIPSRPCRTLVLAAGLALAASGCAWSLGGSRTLHVNYSRGTSIGRELLELQEAKDKGVLTPEEYQRARKSILDMDAAAKDLTEQVLKAK